MSSDPKGAKKGPEKEPAAGAIDGLTPPTMKYSASGDDGERTQIGPAPSGISNTNSGSGSKAGRGSAATITGNMTGMPTLTSGISSQDLSSERLLRDAPRIDANG